MTFSIGVNAQPYKSHTFYSGIRSHNVIITEQIAQNSCGNTFNYRELIGRFYVNIFIDVPLEAGKFYLLDFGEGLNYYYLSQSNMGEHNDEDYRLNTSYHIEQVLCDMDGDGITNEIDNCPNTSNANQADVDNDALGDVCDTDRDGDGIPNSSDSCPDNVNSGNDSDYDGIDDVCDSAINLTLEKLVIKKNGYDVIFDSSDNGNNYTPTLSYSNQYELN